LLCLEKIIDNEEDASTINQADGLQNFLRSKDFLYWLKFFHLIMPNCEIQLQRRTIDIASLKKFIENVRIKIFK
jgi:hypothetical protein